MRWIALKMLFGDRAKFFGIVLGVAFAALLITQQGSIFCGLMCRTGAQIADIDGADLWVMDPNVRFVDDVKPMLESELYRVRGVDGVEWAVPLYKGNARAKLDPRGDDWQRLRYVEIEHKPGLFERAAAWGREQLGYGDGPAGPRQELVDLQDDPRYNVRPKSAIEQVILLGLDDASLVGAPKKMDAGKLADLRRPDAVIVDRVGLRKLFPDMLGETGAGLERFIGIEMEMNDRRAVIVGVCEASRTFQTNPVVYTTYSRAKQFVPRERKLLSYVLAKGAPGISREELARRISDQTGLRARTKDQFFEDTYMYFMKYTGIPINFGIAILLGFLVGTAIAGQTFYLFTVENLKQFGALKAMGASNLSVVGMVMLQALVVGLLGYGTGVGAASAFGMANLASDSELAFFTPWQLPLITAGLVIVICLLSSMLSIRKVLVLEPAVVFRG
jgi:putative ABC transport system permease protein